MMKRWIKSAAAVGFLILFLPYTMTLLINGREGIHKETELPWLEYQVLSRLMQEDYSWMEEGTLDLMAILCRTECLREQNLGVKPEEWTVDPYDNNYERAYEAVVRTQGQAVTIGDTYRELPYHVVSSGRTRDGVLLGETYAYIQAVDCPLDKESEAYLRSYRIRKEDLTSVLGQAFALESLQLDRDTSDYVSWLGAGEIRWKGEEFRSRLHLPSSCFFLEEKDEEIQVTVKGSGHGFGISLYTANRLVQEGQEAPEIFQKFYQDAKCITIP